MILKLGEGERIIVKHNENDEMFIVVEAKHGMILNRTDYNRMGEKE